MALRSFALWRALEAATGARLYSRTGLLILVPERLRSRS